MVTRSKSREFEQEIAVGVREEVSSFLKSEEFRKIVQSAVAETLKACIDQHVQPLQVEVSGLKDAIVRVEDELIEAKQLLNEKVVVLQNVIVNLEEKVARLATKAITITNSIRGVITLEYLVFPKNQMRTVL